MLSVFAPSPRLVPTIPVERAGTPVPITYDGKTKDVTMFECMEDALEPLVSVILATGVQPDQSITLRCNLPTTPSLDLDLNDLRKLHSQSLKFIHALIRELRSKNVRASYRLTVSNSTSYALLRVTSDESISPQTELEDLCVRLKAFISSTIERDHTYLTHLTEVPALIIA